MSIATKHGDGGQTSLIGGARVSKGELRVEAYGTVDELNSMMGLARSLCDDREVNEFAKRIQRELFSVAGALATAQGVKKAQADVTDQMVEALTTEVHRIESIEGILSDWSLPGEHPASSAFDVARTVCRRAERHVVRLAEAGEETAPEILAYLNRLSDLLWLFGRLIELRAGLDASLRDETGRIGSRWSKAW
ncbi:MAG: cob(I)yrinic acid a,c-diamide adenosyltransferase [Pyrinomonadaceae bacterium]